MPAEDPYEYPERPFSIDEALDLKNQVETFVHTAPMVGLKAAETGQAGSGKAVVGIYIGFGGGGHMFGFHREHETWNSVSTVTEEDFPAGIESSIEELIEWITHHYPGEKLIMYYRQDPTQN